jgi:hypothetical protein
VTWASGGRAEGRKAHADLRPEVVREAKRLRRASPKDGKRWSFRQIAQELAQMGHLNERGQPYNAASIKAMVDGPMPTDHCLPARRAVIAGRVCSAL